MCGKSTYRTTTFPFAFLGPQNSRNIFFLEKQDDHCEDNMYSYILELFSLDLWKIHWCFYWNCIKSTFHNFVNRSILTVLVFPVQEQRISCHSLMSANLFQSNIIFSTEIFTSLVMLIPGFLSCEAIVNETLFPGLS